jgi:hypothetical protein
MTVVDQIRAILKGRAAISREMLEPLVDEYTEQVLRVNERLQRCEGLLRKGLRSEAIQLADLEPRILDQVALLDFPELEDWEEILRFYGLETPISLLVDVALQLQDAMLSEQPLNSVLKQHRKLAIARAPLSWRLRVLRQIARLDPGNPNWSEDVEAWEKVRLKELDREVDDAIQKSNLDLLQNIKGELESERWVIKPPDGLAKRIDEKMRSLRAGAILNRLKSLAEQLNNAFCEMDAQQGRLLAQQWQETAKGISQVPPAVWQVAEPALAWIEEMERERNQRETFESLSQKLRDSLDDKAKVTDVMRLHQALVRMDLGIEPSLERLYQSFLENRRLEGQRRNLLLMAGLVGCLLIAAGLIGFFLWQRADLNREIEISSQLEKLVNAQKFEEANSFIGQMNSAAPDIMKRPSITKIVEEVNQWFANEADRVKQFEDYLVRADSTDGETIDLNAVVQAERLARLESEKGKAFALRKRHTEWERGVAERQREDAERDLNVIIMSMTKIESKEALEVDEDEIALIRKRLGDLPINYPKCGDLVLSEVKLAEKRLADLTQSVQEIKSRMQLGQRLLQEVRLASNPDKLSAALTDFNARIVGVSLNPDFDSALADQDAWKAAEKWNRWATSLREFLGNAVDSSEAIRLATAWNDDVRGIRGLPPAILYPQVADDLIAIEGRKDLLGAFRNSLTDSLWSGIGTVEIASGKGRQRRFTYESKEKDIEKKAADSAAGKTVGIEVIVEEDGTYGNWSPEGVFVYLPEPHLTVANVLADLEKRSPNFERNWEREWLAQMARVIKDQRIDVMVKEEILIGMLEAMRRGTMSLKPMCNNALEKLMSRARERKTWFELHDYKTAVDEELISQLQDGFKKVVEQENMLNKMSSARIAYAGVILPYDNRGDDSSMVPVIAGKPEVLPTLGTSLAKYLFAIDSLPANADLVFFHKEGASTSCRVIGSIDRGEFKLKPDAFQLPPNGTPIFTITKSSE